MDEQFPVAVDPEAVGTYPASVGAGGGYVWDEVLEYRVWCHPERGAPDEQDGDEHGVVLCEEAFLRPRPVLASPGRYLYFMRPQSKPAEVPDLFRRRGVSRYDFLTGSEAPLSLDTR